MENFFFALNATIPVFLMILLGFFLQKIHFLNEPFNQTANAYVFRCALPVSLFLSIAEMDFYSDFDLTFCLFCFLGTSLMFMGVWAAALLLMKDKGQVGAFSQASVRSSAAVLGIAFATNIYGNTGMVPMISATATPIALLVVGASFSGSEALKRLKGAAVSSFIKLFFLPAVFLPLAASFGFRDSQMIAILIMSGSPTTVSCFIMAKNMKADSVLTSNAILLSTLLSAVSITLWLFFMRALCWI